MEDGMGTSGNGHGHAKTQEVEQRELSVELTDDELRERGDRMAEAELQIETLKGERRELNAAIKSQVDLRAKLAHTIDSGVEPRDVRCVWIEDYDKNVWRLVRQDNGATVDTRAMTAADRQGSLGLEAHHAAEIANIEAIDADTGEVTTLERVGDVTVERDASGKAIRLFPHVPSDAELAAERAKPKRGPRTRTRVANPSKPPPSFEVETVDVGTQRIDFDPYAAKSKRGPRMRTRAKPANDNNVKARGAKPRKATTKSKNTNSRHANA